MKRIQIKLWFDVPDMDTADKLEKVIADHAQHDIPADVDGQPVEYRGSEVVED
jgi:hypothetical protein